MLKDSYPETLSRHLGKAEKELHLRSKISHTGSDKPWCYFGHPADVQQQVKCGEPHVTIPLLLPCLCSNGPTPEERQLTCEPFPKPPRFSRHTWGKITQVLPTWTHWSENCNTQGADQMLLPQGHSINSFLSILLRGIVQPHSRGKHNEHLLPEGAVLVSFCPACSAAPRACLSMWPARPGQATNTQKNKPNKQNSTTTTQNKQTKAIQEHKCNCHRATEASSSSSNMSGDSRKKPCLWGQQTDRKA